MTDLETHDERVLILAPTGRDASLAWAALTEAGLPAQVCPDIDSLCRELGAGAAAALIAKEALSPPALLSLRRTLERQPPWSDPPLVILTSGGRATPEKRRRLEALATLGNATLLERPLRVTTLVSAVRVALLTRRRQYELRDHLRERARLEGELQSKYEKQYHIAETFQRSLLDPPEPDAFPGLEVKTIYRPAGQEADVGGDFFDLFALENGKVALVVGDVSGKGLAAASRTAEIKYTVRAFLREHPSPARTLSRVNHFLLDSQVLDGQPLDSFVCLALGVVDTASGEIQVAGAGAEAPLVLRIDGEAQSVFSQGPPLGVAAGAAYQDLGVSLGRGDIIVLVTDGITEARRGRDFFGYDGFVETARRERTQGVLARIGQAILNEAQVFAQGRLQDDVCLLLARRR